MGRCSSDRIETEAKSKIEQATKRLGQLKQEIKNARKAREDFVRQPLPFELAYAVAEGKTEGKKKVGNACIQIKGDPERQGPEVPRRWLECSSRASTCCSSCGSSRR